MTKSIKKAKPTKDEKDEARREASAHGRDVLKAAIAIATQLFHDEKDADAETWFDGVLALCEVIDFFGSAEDAKRYVTATVEIQERFDRALTKIGASRLIDVVEVTKIVFFADDDGEIIDPDAEEHLAEAQALAESCGLGNALAAVIGCYYEIYGSLWDEE